LGSGTTDSDSGVAVLPSTAIVYRPEESPITWGLGVYTIGGFSANYPADPTNPIFSPPPPGGVGAGAVYSELALIQYAPTAAVWLTDRLAMGLAPTFTMASLSIDPGFFAAPDDADGDGFPTYPAATHSRWHWGVGFQVGMYYETEGPWSFGLSLKSPQWFETFEFRATDEAGGPRRLAVDVDYPLIVSGGVGFRPSRSLLWATDVRYIDYDNADGFGDPAAFAPDGSATGLGWESILSVATGLHCELNPATSVRIGYLFNENPIPDETAFFNIASPPIFQHAIFLGGSRKLNNCIGVSLSAGTSSGIDLGTTNSAVGYVDTRREPWRVLTFPVPQLVDVGQVEARETLPSFHYQPAAGERAGEGVRLPWQPEPPDHVSACWRASRGRAARGG
jgi:long-chain fatty acid transport protein